MNEAIATTTPRTSAFARLLLSLVVALLLGTMLVPSVDATKKGKNTIASVGSRVQSQRELCETIGGGKLTVTTPNAATPQTRKTECKGGTEDGRYCYNTKKMTKCQRQRKQPPSSGPALPPTVGVYEDPTGAGGTKAGGGATVPLRGSAEESVPLAGEPMLQ